MPAGAGALDHRGHLGVRADAAAEQRRERPGVGDDEVEVRVEPGADALERRQLGIGGADGARDQIVGGGLQAGDVQIALGREVVVEQALRDAGGAGDVVDRHLVVGALGERLLAQLEQLRAAGVVVEPDPPAGAALGDPGHGLGEAGGAASGASEGHRPWVPRGGAGAQPPRSRMVAAGRHFAIDLWSIATHPGSAR
jgi:hypothetical protein